MLRYMMLRMKAESQWPAVGVQVCNCVSTKPGAEWFITIQPGDSSASGSSLIAVLCGAWLLSADVGVRCIAGHIVANVVRNVQVCVCVCMSLI